MIAPIFEIFTFCVFLCIAHYPHGPYFLSYVITLDVFIFILKCLRTYLFLFQNFLNSQESFYTLDLVDLSYGAITFLHLEFIQLKVLNLGISLILS